MHALPAHLTRFECGSNENVWEGTVKKTMGCTNMTNAVHCFLNKQKQKFQIKVLTYS